MTDFREMVRVDLQAGVRRQKRKAVKTARYTPTMIAHWKSQEKQLHHEMFSREDKGKKSQKASSSSSICQEALDAMIPETL